MCVFGCYLFFVIFFFECDGGFGGWLFVGWCLWVIVGCRFNLSFVACWVGVFRMVVFFYLATSLIVWGPYLCVCSVG